MNRRPQESLVRVPAGPVALERVAGIATTWFARRLAPSGPGDEREA